MAKYGRFDISQMLYFLSKYSEQVQLTKVGEKWRLYILSDERGEFEMEGTMLQVVMNAFKPIKSKAEADCDRMAQAFAEIQR